MAVQLTIPYATLLALVEQLPPAEQRELIDRVRSRAQQRALLDEEWQATFQSAMIDRALAGSVSPYRADWYDDDGR